MWKPSTPCDKVIPAFVKALMSMEDVLRDSKVDAGPMKYKYASLGQVLDEVRPKLGAQGLVLSQMPAGGGSMGGISIVSVVFHESGQWIEFPPLIIPTAGGSPQHAGSAISYARRYTTLSICNLATEDDDGHAASAPSGRAVTPVVNARVARTSAMLAELGEAGKAEMRRWADQEGRSLSAKALAADPDWLDRVGAYLDVLLADTDDAAAADEPDPE